MKKNLYQILGVQQNAEQSEIENAFRLLSAKYKALHDRGDQGASTELFSIQSAHDLLTNPEKRRVYDDKLSGLNSDQMSKTSEKDAKKSFMVSTPKRTSIWLILLIASGALIYLIGNFAVEKYSAHNKSKAASEIASAIFKLADTDLIEYMKLNLKDPESLRLRNTKKFSAGLIIDGSKIPSMVSICGELNAKNSYGGYDGFKRFFVSGIYSLSENKWREDSFYFEIFDEDKSDSFERMYEHFCQDSQQT